MNEVTQKYVNEICYEIVGCAIEVHNTLGPGLLESVYEMCMIEELKNKNLEIKSQFQIPFSYKGKSMDIKLRCDLLINNIVIVEIKAVETLNPLFKAQLLTYLKLTGKPKGLLMNFNCRNITEQLVPLVTEEFAKLNRE